MIPTPGNGGRPDCFFGESLARLQKIRFNLIDLALHPANDSKLAHTDNVAVGITGGLCSRKTKINEFKGLVKSSVESCSHAACPRGVSPLKYLMKPAQGCGFSR